ncbi:MULTISPECIES: damage-control phosphatase ARMT1 family protein [Streptomyces]|uniref:damage-control phosphatase ARMT1 family protein n=1 Tax=Streptomyces TaxID=1883 RepID=UPI001A99C060|nr:damage-control phosphatase ARMT1 family protein [Streptomyces sp. CA-256286]QTA33451.1 protein-glutamate O-methyltransferase family protein [Streptomyces sp. CA-256286]WTF70626.1 damage-control phosphatase ARMT1 family protein [Streptomyces microflavus]
MSDKRKARTVAETPTHSPVGGGPGSGSRPASEQDAPVIVSNVPGSFARGVLANRHPALIEQVRDAFPYGPRQHEALDALLDANNNGVIEPLAPSESDQELWWGWGRELFGRSWFDAPFLWAESYFYRRLLGAVGYFGAGPWQGVDPFAPFKRAELRGTAVDEELRALDALAGVPADERATALLHASVRGNRADLGFRVTEGDTAPGAAADDLVADDSPLLWQLLPAGAGATVAVVADNAGRELIPDLILIDHLLLHRHAERIVLHVKPYPYYVSDAMTADVVDCLRRLAEAPGEAGRIGSRLWDAMATGRLQVRAHPFFCAPLPYEEMPGDLRAQFAAATVTILKGDLNYRRLVGDRAWNATTPFADRTAYFPGAAAALRTLKSDVTVGLEQETLDALERSGTAWRTSGTHALIQVRG